MMPGRLAAPGAMKKRYTEEETIGFVREADAGVRSHARQSDGREIPARPARYAATGSFSNSRASAGDATLRP